jgi:hypothetical protein
MGVRIIEIFGTFYNAAVSIKIFDITIRSCMYFEFYLLLFLHKVITYNYLCFFYVFVDVILYY